MTIITTKRFFLAVVLIAALFIPARASAQDEVVYYHTDAIGSVRMTTDASGAVIARYDYAPFGTEWPQNPPTTNPDVRQYAGKEHDAETGLEYFGARYFRSESGRFTTVDPALDPQQSLAEPQLWNRYAYATNNPLRFIDPNGRQREFLDQDIRALMAKQITLDEYNARIQARGVGALVGIAVVGGAVAADAVGALTAGGALISSAFGWALRNPERATDLASDVADALSGGGNLPPGGGIPKFSTAENQGLRTLFGKSTAGADALLARLGRGELPSIPKGVTKETLLNYRKVAEFAIKQGKDSLGVQQRRLQAVDRLLEEYR
jgi:RHS repeat-associated protein